MSWMDRLRGLREEASARVPSQNLTSKGAPPTFVPDIILENIWERDNLDHMVKMATQTPIGARIVSMVAEKALDDWFIIRDTEGNEHPKNKEIQLDLTRLRAKHYFTMALAGERGYGHTWLQVVKEKRPLTIDTEDSEQRPLRIAGLDFWTPEFATVKTYNSVNGAPETIEIEYQVGVADENTLPISKIIPAADMILFRTRPKDRSHEGRPILEPVWDFIVWLHLMFHAVSWYGIKVGMGWLYAKVRKLTEEKKVAMEDNFKNLSVMRFLMFEPDVEEIGFIQASGGSMNFESYIDSILNEIAAGTDVPKVAITGQEQGSISGGEGIEKALYSTINNIQQKVDPYVRELLLRMNYDDSDMVIDWNARYAHNEKEEAEIEVAHVSAQVARLGFMTMNEVRAIDKLAPVEGGEESPAKKADFSIGMQDLDPPSKQEKTNNPEGDQI